MALIVIALILSCLLLVRHQGLPVIGVRIRNSDGIYWKDYRILIVGCRL